MATVDISNIEKVYSGASSCMCGCKGKWSYNTPENSLLSYQSVNVRSVKIIAGKVLNHPDVKYENGNAFVDIPETGRVMAVYFRGK